MTKRESEDRELLFDVQTPLPDVSLANLTLTQRKAIDAITKFVVGTTLAWVSVAELVYDIQRLRTEGISNGRRRGSTRTG